MNIFGPGGLAALLGVVVILAAVLVVAVVLIARARRLDRLHVRVDAARAGLVSVLDRRAAVVRAVAAAPSAVVPASDRRALRAAARVAEGAGSGAAREVAENDLARVLGRVRPSALPGDLAAELADADARVVVARRVHNDAVRDTRALRGRRMVRVLHLAGTAAFPRYFDIVETEPDEPAPAASVSEVASLTSSVSEVASLTSGSTGRARDAARVVTLDPHGRVLLLRARGGGPAGADTDAAADGADAEFWFTPGGGVEPGEAPHLAAVRALAATIGLAADPDELAGPVWVRDVAFAADGAPWTAHEFFYVLRVADAAEVSVDTTGASPVAGRVVGGHRWWTATELVTSVAVVHPGGLGELVGDPASLDPVDPPVLVR